MQIAVGSAKNLQIYRKTSARAKQRLDPQLVGDILNLTEAVDVNDYLLENDISEYGKNKFRFANKTLFKLYEVIHKNKSINFFLEQGESLDKVLDVFLGVCFAGVGGRIWRGGRRRT